MTTFRTATGETFTGPDLAALVRQEGRLGTQFMVDGQRLRCPVGVLGDYCYPATSLHRSAARHWVGVNPVDTYGKHFRIAIWTDNDAFEGSPEERAEYIAGRLERI